MASGLASVDSGLCLSQLCLGWFSRKQKTAEAQYVLILSQLIRRCLAHGWRQLVARKCSLSPLNFQEALVWVKRCNEHPISV